MEKLIFIVSVIAITFLAGCTSEQAQTPTPPSSTGTEHVIEIFDTGFSPNTITIKNGDKVTFVNKDSNQHWPASDLHPSHCIYKGCNVFDSRRGLEQNENYTVTFDIAGNWKYHDHLNPGFVGTITV